MFLVGLLDDVIQLRPQVKFVLQTLAGVALVTLGAVFPLTSSYGINVLVTVFWFVAVTNAFNLLDNMDGVAAGVAAMAAVFLGIAFAWQNAWLHAALTWSIAGATLGFLRYNFHPASIFLGDAGSLFIGSALAGLVVTSPSTVSGSLVSVLLVPLTIVAVPILDTALVTVTRALSGRAISQGGRDHSAHRLVALGLSERQVALLLYGVAALGWVVALFLTRLDHGLGVLVGTAFLVALCLLAAYLSGLQVGHSNQSQGSSGVTHLVGTLLYKRRLGELLLDVTLITLAYYGAYRLRFDASLPPEYAQAFQTTLGLVVAVKIAAFGLFGVYSGAWQYAGIVDLYRIMGALVVGDAVILGYGEWRVPALAHSHAIVYIDALLSAALVLTSRLSFRSLKTVRDGLRPRRGTPVVIYGAGDAGELVLRELVNNQTLDFEPVCFLDDDARKHRATIHGIPVIGGLESLALAVERHGVRKIVIGSRNLPLDRLAALAVFARRHALELMELDLGLRTVPIPPIGPGILPGADIERTA
jgi:UDP-GlcNAc:undecaprenyl-phosphate GlcNAc-1-phosphate transferase